MLMPKQFSLTVAIPIFLPSRITLSFLWLYGTFRYRLKIPVGIFLNSV